MRLPTVLATLVLALLGTVAGATDTRPPLQQVFGEASYDARVERIDALLGFAHGLRAAAPEEIHGALQRWAAQSERLRVQEYGRSHQGRPLSVAIVSSPANLARIDVIQRDLQALADPRGTDESRAQALIGTLPAVGYLGHSIHGNETSGADAALGLIFHLIASNDAAVARLLERTVVIIDPQMNPDGRARAVADLRGFASDGANADDQTLARGSSWPFGRGNHYVFDMNRDWIYATQPETRGRIALLRDWHPLLFVDAHEMGAQDTFLMSPPRAPINPHYAPEFLDFARRFSQEQAQAFDQRGWVYYTGEWNEGWYPGYSDAWGGLRGAVNMLYEQARVADTGVRQANGRVLGYAEGVARQLGAAWANVQSLERHATDLQRAFWQDRKRSTAAAGSYGGRLFALPAAAHPSRIAELAALLELQGIEAHRLTRDWRVRGARDGFGRRRDTVLPAGSLLVPNRQPLARLVANLFEFDPRPDPASLQREREELLRTGAGTMYDVTSWNLPMMYGLETYAIESDLPGASEPWPRPSPTPAEATADSAVAWLIPGHDDGATRAAAALLERGLRPRVALKPVEFDGRAHPRGSLLLTRYDHRDLSAATLRDALAAVAPLLAQPALALGSGLGAGDLPDLGGESFGLLQPPSVAVIGRGRIDPQAFGAAWHYLDRSLGLAPSLLAEESTAYADLRRYNVIVLPERWGGESLPPALAAALKSWAEAGGTLVAFGNAAAALAGKDGPMAARTLPASLEDLTPYRAALAREWMAGNDRLAPEAALWSHTAVAGRAGAWPEELAKDAPEVKAMQARDAWQRLFMPQGAFALARCDTRHWLSFGCHEALPVLVDASEPLMAADSVAAPFRLGLYEAEAGAKDEWRSFGWGGFPPGQNLRLRAGGLLWPEAQERLANTAWVTQERVGRGQAILFATSPVFRGASLGMQRVLGNAVVYGPGLGTSALIAP